MVSSGVSHRWGTPTAVNKHDYPTEYRVKDKRGEWHVQCDCIMIVTVRKAEERTQVELEVATSYVDLFRIDSSQSQRSDDPPSPLVDARRDDQMIGRIGTRWTTTSTTTTMAEVSEAAAMATEGGGSARRGSSGGRNT